MGYIYNVCCKCGEPIRIAEKREKFANDMLKGSTVSVCKDCEKISAWRRY